MHKEVMNKNPGILFIADGSLTNPILSSQGIPLLEYLSSQNYRCFLLSFEEEISYKGLELEEKYNQKITFKKIIIPASIFPDWMKAIIRGTISTYKLIDKENILIIHARSFTPGLIALIIKKFIRGKIGFLYDNRGLFIDEQIYLGKWREKGLKEGIARLLEKQILKFSDKTIVVSNQFKDYLNIKYEMLYDKKLIVIKNRTKIFPFESYGLKDSKKMIGIFSGSGAKWQYLQELYKMINISLSNFDDFEFKIFTYENDNYELNNFGSNVNLYSLKPEEVKKEMQKGDFGILLREKIPLNRVSSPLKFSEYLSCGLPVLCSEGIGDTEQIINEYGVGVIIKDNNYMEALNSIRQLLKDPGIKSRCYSVANKEFNILDSFEEYKNVYGEIISE